jgi:hypothetical protein
MSPSRIEPFLSKMPNGTHIDKESSSDSKPDEHPDLSVGYDLEDQQTRAQLDLIDDLKKLGVESYLDLPHVKYMSEVVDFC